MSDCAERDWSATWRSFLTLWGAPVAVATAISAITAPAWIAPAAWTLAFGWTGAACLINARRCGRLHCYFSGPILLVGALVASLVAIDAIDAGPNSLVLIVVVTLALASLTYFVERVWGRYLA